MNTKIVWIVNGLLLLVICGMGYTYQKLTEQQDRNMVFISNQSYLEGYEEGHIVGSIHGWKDGAVFCVKENAK